MYISVYSELKKPSTSLIHSTEVANWIGYTLEWKQGKRYSGIVRSNRLEVSSAKRGQERYC